jgi:D-alanyl-lipoteichoic acid acyltransferase DltB (MBOAT superfamily)
VLFNSHAFLLLFLPSALAGYYGRHWSDAGRGWYLIAISLVFYGVWDPRFVPLLVASVAANWLAAWLFHRRSQRLALTAAIVGNLIVLAIFKSLGFFTGIANSALGTTWPIIALALPLGISFFTFHHIIYMADAARGAAPLYTFRDYALYITLFPQILAGPLVRHSEIVHQFRLDPRREGVEERVARGLVRLILGLAEKIFIADAIAAKINPLFAQLAAGETLSVADSWVAVLGFTFQIYFDFAGYTDMAIGLALMFGFVLPENFKKPYAAVSLQDFWRRWHMTLSRFLRDYLYIPLGGNRFGLPHQLWALMATMLLGGLWHGAGWTFVMWGGLHGVGLAVGVLWRRLGLSLPSILAIPLTFLFVILTWVFFRAGSFQQATNLLTSMLGGAEFGRFKSWEIVAIAAAVAFVAPTAQRISERITVRAVWAMVAAFASFLILVRLNQGGSYEFIYFQF